ncbi:CPBP family intramembrane glutamic endopeptidase [Nocardioides litoris]|uniref:CPBP family intramembrane glutamic endopeptidase n=1 Tax=Nocardioides litoris TaxID=1926648 RepID=UPI0011215613|nr:type II CAAX endopeptidase family protein [Nocardioides litoris]
MSLPQPAGEPGTAPGADPEATELAYHRLLRAGRPGRPGGAGWSVLAALAALLAFLLAQVVATIGFGAYAAARGDDLVAAVAPSTFSPLGLAYLLASIALSIPAVLVGAWLVSGIRPRFLTSVVGRLRWGWLATCLGVSLVVFVLTIVVGGLLPTGGTATSADAQLGDVTSTTWQFLTILVVLGPLQAAAEEYVFRGLLAQGFGSLGRNLQVARVVAVVVPAVIFALLHGTQSAAAFVDRLGFGLAAGVLAIVTGGLEAGIAFHAVNNYLAFGIAIFYDDLEAALEAQGGNGWDVVVSLVKYALLLGLVLAAARATGLRTTAPRTELVAPGPRV